MSVTFPFPIGETKREKVRCPASFWRRRPCFLSRSVAGIKELEKENELVGAQIFCHLCWRPPLCSGLPGALES